MSKLLRNRYFIFILTVSLVIIGNGYILDYKLNLQDKNAIEINVAGRQRMLSQGITKYIYYIENDYRSNNNISAVDSLTKYTSQFVNAHQYLKKINSNSDKTIQMDFLFSTIEEPFQSIVNIGNSYIKKNTSSVNSKHDLATLSTNEHKFLAIMEKIVNGFQANAELQLKKTKQISLILTFVSLLLLLGEFIFLIIPFYNSLTVKNEQLTSANRKLTDFANITSHNLRAPLGNFKTLLSFFRSSSDEEDRELLLDNLPIVSNRMDDTMNVLLDAVSVQKTTNQLEKKIIYFKNVSNNIKEDLSTQLEESGATIIEEFNNAPDINYTPVYLESIMLNFMTNSIKFRDIERPLEIKVSTTKKGKKTILTHSDNGRGLDMERHGDKLFGMNKVFHKNTDSKGIGLFMTRMQIEAMGGTITAESQPNLGMTFIVEF